ncbi:19312_t:CDS:1, partial [Racocetra persica]
GFIVYEEQNNFVDNLSESTTEYISKFTTESITKSTTKSITKSTTKSTIKSTVKFNNMIYNASSNQQKPIKSTVDLLKDIETISNQVDHIEINNILTLFVKQLNRKYLLLQEKIDDPIIAKTKVKPSGTKYKKDRH